MLSAFEALPSFWFSCGSDAVVAAVLVLVLAVVVVAVVVVVPVLVLVIVFVLLVLVVLVVLVLVVVAAIVVGVVVVVVVVVVVAVVVPSMGIFARKSRRFRAEHVLDFLYKCISFRSPACLLLMHFFNIIAILRLAMYINA